MITHLALRALRNHAAPVKPVISEEPAPSCRAKAWFTRYVENDVSAARDRSLNRISRRGSRVRLLLATWRRCSPGATLVDPVGPTERVRATLLSSSRADTAEQKDRLQRDWTRAARARLQGARLQGARLRGGAPCARIDYRREVVLLVRDRRGWGFVLPRRRSGGGCA